MAQVRSKERATMKLEAPIQKQRKWQECQL